MEINEKIENIPLSIEKEEDPSYIYIFKIILIGDMNIGKTSLIGRYIHSVFQERYISTIGVDFMMKSLLLEKQLIKLQIWDTAGMEKYKQITTSYYRGAQVALVCFDLTCKSSFNSVDKWISDFLQFQNQNIRKLIILVGNKADLVEERVVTVEEIETKCKLNNYIYFETSAKTGHNVESLFEYIAKELYTLNKLQTQETQKAIRLRNSITDADKFKFIITEQERTNKKCCY
jgi:small GTP-binding protein